MVVAVPARYLWLVRVGVWLVYTAVAIAIIVTVAPLLPPTAPSPWINALIGLPFGLVGGFHATLGFEAKQAPAPSSPTPLRKPKRGSVIVPFLREHPGSTAEEIAAGTGLPYTVMSRSLAYLQLDGFVVVDPDLTDGRMCYSATGKEEEI